MQNNTIPNLILVLILSLLLLAPCTPYGQEVIGTLFPPGNFSEGDLIPAPDAEDTPETVRLSQFYTGHLRELPGSYTLVSLRGREEEYSDTLLQQLRQLGVPMQLTLREDGTAALRIFDQETALLYFGESMLMRTDEITLPFFWQDGKLWILDGEDCLIFERESRGTG